MFYFCHHNSFLQYTNYKLIQQVDIQYLLQARQSYKLESKKLSVWGFEIKIVLVLKLGPSIIVCSLLYTVLLYLYYFIYLGNMLNNINLGLKMALYECNFYNLENLKLMFSSSSIIPSILLSWSPFTHESTRVCCPH